MRRTGRNWRRKGKTSDEEVVTGKDGCGEDEEECEESDSNATLLFPLGYGRRQIQILH